jgi:hypothetical protein
MVSKNLEISKLSSGGARDISKNRILSPIKSYMGNSLQLVKEQRRRSVAAKKV